MEMEERKEKKEKVLFVVLTMVTLGLMTLLVILAPELEKLGMARRVLILLFAISNVLFVTPILYFIFRDWILLVMFILCLIGFIVLIIPEEFGTTRLTGVLLIAMGGMWLPVVSILKKTIFNIKKEIKL